MTCTTWSKWVPFYFKYLYIDDTDTLRNFLSHLRNVETYNILVESIDFEIFSKTKSVWQIWPWEGHNCRVGGKYTLYLCVDEQLACRRLRRRELVDLILYCSTPRSSPPSAARARGFSLLLSNTSSSLNIFEITLFTS